MCIFVLFDPYFFLFPPLRSLVPGYVIKDAVEENLLTYTRIDST